MAPRIDASHGSDALSSVEQVLYKAVSDTDILYQRDVEAACPGYPVAQLQEAMNALLRKNLLKMMRDSKGKPCFKAVKAKDARLLGALQGDESMVYTHIRNAGNEGVWTKTLKSKTNLHATVINRCLKQLEQRQLVKSVKNVKFPTRKTYMLFNLKPSVELTGGPWFNDNELDVGFIEGLLSAVFTFIEKRTFIGENYQVWPTSRTDKYPTLSDIRKFVHTSGLTEVKLEDEHVKNLLDVLVYDGKIESLPGSGSGGWDDDDDEPGRDRRRGKDKRKRKRARSDDDSEDESDVEERRRRKKKKKSRVADSDEDDDDASDDDGSDRHRHRRGSSSKKRKRSSDSEAASDEEPRHSRKKHRRSPSPTPSASRSPSPITFTLASPPPSSYSSSVYRALRRETYGAGLALTEVPCGVCEVADFCRPKGPVNARDCEYYKEWLVPERGPAGATGKGRLGVGAGGAGKGVQRQAGEGVGEGEEGEGEEGETWDEEGYGEGEEGEGEVYDDGGGMEIGYQEEYD